MLETSIPIALVTGAVSLLALMIGALVWVLKAGTRHFLRQQEMLERRWDTQVEVLRGIRDDLQRMTADATAGRERAVGQVASIVSHECDRVIEEFREARA